MSDTLKDKLLQEGKLCPGKNFLTIKIANITTYIDANIAENLSLDSLAKEFGISKFYFSHLFKAHTGLSVFKYIKLKRLALAKEYYESGKQLTEAATKAGFSDYTAFYKAYRNEYGSSPSKHISK